MGSLVLCGSDDGTTVIVLDNPNGVICIGDYRRVLHANAATRGNGRRFILTAYCSKSLVDLVRAMAPKFGAGGSGSASAEPLIDEVARYDPRGMRIPGTQYPDETERRSQSGLDFDSAFEQDRMSMRAHGSSWRTFLVDSFVLMFGGTQLAYAMGQMGWFWGVFWLSFSAGSTWLSGHVLGALCIETGAATYPELGRACLGRGGEIAAVCCQWFGYYLTGVV